MHPKTRSLIPVAALFVWFVGLVSVAVLIYFDDRQLVWYQGSPFDMGQFVEVEQPSASAPSEPSSRSESR